MTTTSDSPPPTPGRPTVAQALSRLGPSDWLAVIVALGSWTGLARAALGGPYYAAMLDIALLALAAVAVRRRRTVFARNELLLAGTIALFAAVAAVEILNPNVPSLRAGLEGFRKTAFTMLAFFVVIVSRDGDGFRFARIVAAGCVPAFLMAIRQAIAPLPLELDIISSSGISSITFHAGGVLRAFSPTAGPFHLGALAALVTITALVLAWSHSRWWLGVSVVSAIALGLTITRANMVALVVAIVVVAGLAFLRRRTAMPALQAGPALAGMVLAALIAVGATPLTGPGGIVNVPLPSSPPGASPSSDPLGEIVKGLENPLADKNLQLRFGYWREYAAVVARRPLIGYGTSAAADGFDHFYEGTGSQNFEPHSLYFKPAIEMGLGGLALLLAILGLAAAAAWRAQRRSLELAAVGLGSLVFIAVSGTTGPMLDAYPINLLFWASCGWMARVGFGSSEQSVAMSVGSSART